MRRTIWCVSGLVCLAGAARAAPLDCAAIKNSTLPFQMRFRSKDGPTGPLKVFRGMDLRRHTIWAGGDREFQSDLQGNFQLASGGLKGTTIRWDYDVPTDRFLWESGVTRANVTTTMDGKQVDRWVQVYTMRGDGSLAIDGCTFATKLYSVESTTRSIVMTQEITFAPELDTIVASKGHTVFATGNTTESTSEVIEISTDLGEEPH